MKTRFVLLMAMIIAAAAPAAAQNSSSPVTIEGPWMRISKNDAGITAYLEILNVSDEDDQLLSVTSPIAARAAIYRTRWHGLDVYLERLDGLAIRGNSRTSLRPAGTFLKLEQLSQPVAVGEYIPLTLTFARSGQVHIKARVGNQMLGNR